MKWATRSLHQACNPNLKPSQGSRSSQRPTVKDSQRHGETQSSVDFRGSGKRKRGQQEFCTTVCFKFGCLGAVMCNASMMKNKHPAEAGLELRRVHNKFQLVKLIARCLLWILIPGRELASTQSKDRWKLQTEKHLGSLGGRLTCEPGIDAESQREAESVKQPHLLHRHSCVATTSPPCPRPSPVPSGALPGLVWETPGLRLWKMKEPRLLICVCFFF